MRHPKFLCASLLLAWCALGSAQEYEGRTLVKASLVPGTSGVAPGQPFEVGLLLEMAPHWHTYWEFPGDAGIPTTIKWDLPPGFSAGPLQWPIPKREIEPGDIQVLAYGDRVMATARITPPADLQGTGVTLKARAAWLVCESICIPGSAELALELPIEAAPQRTNEALFSAFPHPEDSPPPFPLRWQDSGDHLILTVSGLGDDDPIDLFPMVPVGEEVGHPVVSRSGTEATFRIKVRPPFQALLVVTRNGDTQAWPVEFSKAVASVSGTSETGSARPPATASTLLLSLLYGFIGGLILNLMPCVLPVISLKIFGFVRQAGDAPAKIFRHGLAFAAGIFAWFLGLAAVVVAIKVGGGEATWAFQFQNPWFNFTIACILFVFALNLFGVFEIVLPGQAVMALDRTGSEGYDGSFFQGMFATLLATPCTAPFLGTALGFAFSQSAAVIFAMFASVAFGMAAPYLLLSAKPGWMKILPRPGAWMERVKQFMGFPLLATLVWMLAILGAQKGTDAIIWICAFFVCLGFALWIYGNFCGPLTSPLKRTLAVVAALLVIAWSGHAFIWQNFASATAPDARIEREGGILWVPFSQASLNDLLAEGRPVFVDFTADWCISCKFNERTAIDRPAVRKAFEQGNFVMMKADWTNANPEITKALAKFGRVGVPFYVLYPEGRTDAPIILPELLTEQMVLDAIAGALPAR